MSSVSLQVINGICAPTSSRQIISFEIYVSTYTESSEVEKKSQRSQEFTVERMADDLKRLITESSSQPQPFILVGLELGALSTRYLLLKSSLQLFILVGALSLSTHPTSTTCNKHVVVSTLLLLFTLER